MRLFTVTGVSDGLCFLNSSCCCGVHCRRRRDVVTDQKRLSPEGLEATIARALNDQSFVEDNQSSNQVCSQTQLRLCNCISCSGPRAYPCLLESPLLLRSDISLRLRPPFLFPHCGLERGSNNPLWIPNPLSARLLSFRSLQTSAVRALRACTFGNSCARP